MPSGYALQEIEPDGNCLFSAIHEGCRRQKISTPWGNAYKLRELAMNNLTIAKDTNLLTSIRHHLADQPGYKQRFPSYMSDRQVLETYQKEMKKPKRPNSVASHQWGGDLELDAIAKTHNITIKLYHPLPLTNQRLTSQWTTYTPSTRPDNGTIHLVLHNSHYDLLLPQKDQEIENEKEKNKEKDTNRTRAKGSSHAKVNQRLGHICTTSPNDEQLKNKQQGRGLGYDYGNLYDIGNIINSNASGTITRSSLRKKQ